MLEPCAVVKKSSHIVCLNESKGTRFFIFLTNDNFLFYITNLNSFVIEDILAVPFYKNSFVCNYVYRNEVPMMAMMVKILLSGP